MFAAPDPVISLTPPRSTATAPGASPTIIRPLAAFSLHDFRPVPVDDSLSTDLAPLPHPKNEQPPMPPDVVTAYQSRQPPCVEAASSQLDPDLPSSSPDDQTARSHLVHRSLPLVHTQLPDLESLPMSSLPHGSSSRYTLLTPAPTPLPPLSRTEPPELRRNHLPSRTRSDQARHQAVTGQYQSRRIPSRPHSPPPALPDISRNPPRIRADLASNTRSLPVPRRARYPNLARHWSIRNSSSELTQHIPRHPATAPASSPPLCAHPISLRRTLPPSAPS